MIRRNTQLHALTQSRIQHLPGTAGSCTNPRRARHLHRHYWRLGARRHDLMIYSFGRKPTLLIFGLAHFYLSSLIPVCPSAIARCLCARVPSGFFASESFSPMGAFLTELFSTRLRGRGQGFSYNVGCALGPFLPRWLPRPTRDSPLHLLLTGNT